MLSEMLSEMLATPPNKGTGRRKVRGMVKICLTVITKATLHAEVSKLQSEKSISYSEALNLFRTQNPDYYKQAYGV